MKIASWNVNSVRARLPNVLGWLEKARPDILLLQEIKCQTGDFPSFEFQAQGYHSAVVGQKSYNGVALLSRQEPTSILESLPGDNQDTQARYVEAMVGGVRVASLYLPNGNPVGTEKYDYKLAWMKRLKTHIKKRLEEEIPFVLGGDFNVIPQAEDVYDPQSWLGDALFALTTRQHFREILALGMTEAFRALHPHVKEAYTFWDYQAGAWQRNLGLRIDHFLLSPEATDCLISCEIDREPRGLEKASDHTPILIELDLTKINPRPS
ncbi:MAG: exodeoxyribonuclease III [Proteobacteria bacterium]|nr:exodeoxyribonuclease III [Pseudomonadota bacterium]